MGTNIFDLVTLTLVIDLLIENFDLGYIFCFAGTTALTFHTRASCVSDKTFRGYNKTFSWMATKV
jgi:hypothetical protein